MALTAQRRHGRVIRTPQAGDQLINVFLVIVVASAIGYIGIDVTSEINDSTSVDSSSNFGQANDNISSGFAQAFGIVDIVYIVLMFGVILSVLLSFRMRGG